MTALRFPHFAPAPAGRPIRRIPVARRVERRVAWRMEPRRHETGGAIPRLLRLGRNLLLALPWPRWDSGSCCSPAWCSDDRNGVA